MPAAAPARPNWRLLALATVASAALALGVSPPTTALYWYVFPLFGIGIAYVVQFRSELPFAWRLAGVGMVVVSVVALALDWPYSGHVMWNVVFIGHAWRTGKRASTWMVLLVASLVYLFVMKLASQTARDVVGGVIAAGVGVLVLVALRRAGPDVRTARGNPAGASARPRPPRR
ncbi:MAG: hypothetical protein QM733_17030 [Ilumatobacteraceae bacterium]